MSLGPKQLLSLSTSSGKVNIWEGSIRSGKTIASLLRWITYLAAGPTMGELVMVGRTRDAVWRNCILPLMEPAITGKFSKHIIGNFGAPTVSVFGRRIHVMGASDVKAEFVLRGMTVAGAYADEITTLPEGFFVQLLGRMSVPGAKLFGTTNPDGPRHWFKKKYLDKARKGLLENWKIYHFVMDDNPGLTESYKKQKAQEFTGLWYKRFILGLWVQAEGAVYDSWDEQSAVVPYEQLPPMQAILGVGCDYGTTNPSRGISLGLGVDPADGISRLYLLDEWTPPKGTDAELSLGLRTWLANSLPAEASPWVMIDPAAASFRLQVFQDGLTRSMAASNAVLPGIQLVHSLMAADRLRVSGRCQTFLEEVPGYVWDPDQTKKGKDSVVKENDHTLDAARYVIYSTRNTWRDAIPLELALKEDEDGMAA